MSAAGRGRERAAYDYYPTPAWCVDRLLDDCAGPLFSGVSYALEPTVGDGAIVRAVEDWHKIHCRHAPWEWTGCEIRPGALDPRTPLGVHLDGQDFLQTSSLLGFDVAIGNPPFNLAEAIVRKTLEVSERVAMLLRVGFLGSEERADFWSTVGRDVALRVLPDRPSFDGQGTDSATYAWFVWGCEGVQGVKVLAPTPVAVRNAQKPTTDFERRQVSLFSEAS